MKEEVNVQVIVRVRPIEDEMCINLTDNMISVAKDDFSFDKVFLDSAQEDVFEQSGIKEYLDRAIDGYSVTVFAYGQTSSGKSYTITGGAVPDGIIPRALNYIFGQRQNQKLTIKASYLEIYNEQVHDLLNMNGRNLQVRWNLRTGFYVENLFIVQCDIYDDALAVMEEGLRNRSVAAHALNEQSSRSHSIMNVYIESEIQTELNMVISKLGKISFVDLAGSERVKDTKTKGINFTETSNINRSLLTLGQCISALSDPKKLTTHIPYRESQLTKLLMDSLGGNGYTLMIACLNPSKMHVYETLQTLRYASRAKVIKNQPRIIMDPREDLILKLQTSNQELKERLREYESGTTPIPASSLGNNPNDTTKSTKDRTLHDIKNKTVNASFDKLVRELAQIKYEKEELERMNELSELNYSVLMQENDKLRNEKVLSSRSTNFPATLIPIKSTTVLKSESIKPSAMPFKTDLVIKSAKVTSNVKTLNRQLELELSQLDSEILKMNKS